MGSRVRRATAEEKQHTSTASAPVRFEAQLPTRTSKCCGGVGKSRTISRPAGCLGDRRVRLSSPYPCVVLASHFQQGEVEPLMSSPHSKSITCSHRFFVTVVGRQGAPTHAHTPAALFQACMHIRRKRMWQAEKPVTCHTDRRQDNTRHVDVKLWEKKEGVSRIHGHAQAHTGRGRQRERNGNTNDGGGRGGTTS